jgi:hypothetical protein
MQFDKRKVRRRDKYSNRVLQCKIFGYERGLTKYEFFLIEKNLFHQEKIERYSLSVFVKL